MFLGHVYGQKGCSAYNCSNLLMMDDFMMVQNDHFSYLQEHQLKLIPDMTFTKEFNSLKVLTMTGRPELGYRKLTSTPIVGDYSSLVVRFRSNVRAEMKE